MHGFVEDGTPVTADLAGRDLRATWSQRYYGPGFTVDENDGMEWAYIPHFYYKYYVYSYATGLSCGLAIAEQREGNGPAGRGRLPGHAQGRLQRSPAGPAAEGAGVDLTRPDAIEAALERFDRTITELAELLEVEM